MRASCDLSCSEAASEGEEFSSRLFDIAGCDSSATDEDGDYEPRPSRKRGVGSGGAVAGKKVKQEATSAEDFDAVSVGLGVTDAVAVLQACEAPNTLTLCPQTQRGQEGPVGPEMELLGGGSCVTGTEAERRSSATETTGKTAGRERRTSLHLEARLRPCCSSLFVCLLWERRGAERAGEPAGTAFGRTQPQPADDGADQQSEAGQRAAATGDHEKGRTHLRLPAGQTAAG